MHLKAFFILLLAVFFIKSKAQQACTVLGQMPATAFPVCGTKVFDQASVPVCENHSVPGCGTTDKNPFWYKFTCYESGTLGFVITPKILEEDYDWQLFDITGHAVDEVYTNEQLTISTNWAGTYGTTGTSSTGVTYRQCGSDPNDNLPTFAAMPNLVKGHVYLLMISHYSDTQSGYSLSFGGGTASITDTLQPAMINAFGDCEAKQITIAMNKKMQCTSLEKDGSDFSIDAPGVSVISANAVSCNTGFDMDTLVLTLSQALNPGIYNIITKFGKTDNNTLLDNCGNSLPLNASVPFTILPKTPTPLDSITPPLCAPQTLQLVFKKPIRCSSIAPDGSDFEVDGPWPISVSGAEGICTNGTTTTLLVHLGSAVVHEGNYNLILKNNGSDGNTIIDECGQETPANSSVTFSVKDTVSAVFDAQLLYGCKNDTIAAAHDGRNGVNQWAWTFDVNLARNTQAAQVVYDSYGEKNITLAVSNGFCSDTASAVVNLDNELKAGMYGPLVACPKDVLNFTDSSIGNIISYEWNFGLAASFSQKIPPAQSYPQADGDKNYTVKLIVENDHFCFDTAVQIVKVPLSCYIAVPSAFTPNGDGKNDYLFPLNAYKADHLDFKVFNRYGQLIFQTTDWTKKWNGTFNGQPAGADTYVWMLGYTQHDTGKYVFLKGTTVLIR